MSKVSDANLQDILTHIGNNRFLPQIVQHFDKSMIFSTDEVMVGQWINGKPLYRKTIQPNFKISANAVLYDLSTEFPNMDDVFIDYNHCQVLSNDQTTFIPMSFSPGNTSTYGLTCMVLTDSGVKKMRFYIGSSAANQYTVKTLTLIYTKTTDTALPYELGDENDYSTTEKLVGKWIDGSDIFQKTINASSLSVGDNAIPHGISNLDTVINLSGSAKRVGDGFKFAIPTIYIPNPNVWSIAPSGVTATDVKLSIGTGFTGTYVLSDVKITLQYTKSS